VVGTAYSRTEPAQAAIFGIVLLGEAPHSVAAFAICLAVVGVMLISVARTAAGWKPLVTAIFSRSAGIGILSGTLFGIAAVAYRAASLSLGGPNFLMQAGFTLAATILLQTAAMLAWLIWRERDELVRIAAAWRPSLLTGMAGAAASFGWFSAMTLQQAAVVKAVAQVEMLFTFAAAVFWFREHINRAEIAGCVLITGGILVLLLAA
jgi:drug/metabolite transporter (DMT)-like permease